LGPMPMPVAEAFRRHESSFRIFQTGRGLIRSPQGAFLGALTHKTAPDQTDTMSSVDKNRQASLEAGKRKVPPRPGSHPRYLRASTHRDPPRPLIKMSERKVISPSSADSPSADIPFRPPRIDSWRLSSSASSR
jgi:hypothetical protein